MNIIIDMALVAPHKSCSAFVSSDANDSSYLKSITINENRTDNVSFINIDNFIVSNSFYFSFFKKFKDSYKSKANMLEHIAFSNLSIVNQKDLIRGVSRVYPIEYN